MMLRSLCVITLTLLSLLGSVQAQQAFDNEMPWFNQTAANDKYALIITGAAATPEIRERFRRWTSELRSSLIEDYGYGSSRVRLLLDDGDNVGNLASVISGSSRVEDIRRQLSVLAEQVSDGDQLSVFLIGHGSGTFGEAKFNNVGPDMTGAELADMLSVFTAQDLIVFNTTSASFEFSRELSMPGRVVVSATRSAAERYDPLFAEYLIAGLQGHAADLDRNGRVSVLEIFNYASNRVADWYREQGRLATENAVLDDTGDGLFSREPGQQQADGLLAEIAYLDVIRPVVEKTSPRAREVLSQIQSLERDIFILRNQKANYLEDDYWNRLEALLIDLAIQTREYNALP